MSAPIVTWESPDDEFWAGLQLNLNLPAPLAESLHVRIVNAYNLIPTDRRLQGYQARVVISDLTPEDPTDWARCIDDATRQQFRLWEIYVRYQQSPLLGELRYEANRGWIEIIYHPTWLTRRATPDEYEKLSRGLAIMQQVYPRPGKPRGTKSSWIGPFQDIETFIRHVDDYIRQVHMHGGILTKDTIAKHLNISVSTLERSLSNAGLKWKDIKVRGISNTS
jgi:hypothetical protein